MTQVIGGKMVGEIMYLVNLKEKKSKENSIVQ